MKLKQECNKFMLLALLYILAFTNVLGQQTKSGEALSGNPVIPGWYADPEAKIFDHQYWIYPTTSQGRANQMYFDAFSSPDLVHWTKHPNALDGDAVKWLRKALWAPAVAKMGGKYYLFFGANDIHDDKKEIGGIGVAVADNPGGPFTDYLGRPLLNKIVNGAQPIDMFIFKDKDGQYYMIYGGWGHCNIVKLNKDFTGFVPFNNGIIFKSITPDNYVEGPLMFLRKGKYYLMWSEGDWGGPGYQVAYAISNKPDGPFKRIGVILKQDAHIATGAGHNSVLQVPGTDDWYIVYHRRPLGETLPEHRVTCIDHMYFDKDGYIKPVVMTFSGVAAEPLR